MRSERRAALRRWEWAIRYPLQLNPEPLERDGNGLNQSTDALVVKHLSVRPCPRCGAPPVYGWCALCLGRQDEPEPSRSDAAARTPDPEWPLPEAPRRYHRPRATVTGFRTTGGVPEVLVYGIWTVVRNLDNVEHLQAPLRTGW